MKPRSPTRAQAHFTLADPAAPIATPADFDPDGALSRDYLLRRGHCCQEGCRNCPYGFVAPDNVASAP